MFLIIILLLLLLFVLSPHIFNPITLYVINKSVFSLLNELRKNAYKQVGNDYIVIFLFCKYCWNSLYMEIVLGVSKLGVIWWIWSMKRKQWFVMIIFIWNYCHEITVFQAKFYQIRAKEAPVYSYPFFLVKTSNEINLLVLSKMIYINKGVIIPPNTFDKWIV